MDRDRTGLADDGFGRLIPSWSRGAQALQSISGLAPDATRCRNGCHGAAKMDGPTGMSLGITHNF